MRDPSAEYEPVFGGIVAILAAALLFVVLFTWQSAAPPGVLLVLVSGRAVFWGAGQIVGYRRAKRLLGSATPSPLLGTALGCVFVGLMLAPVTLLLYEFGSRPLYGSLTAAVATTLLVVGATLGIRQGVWRATPYNRWRGP